MCSRGRTRGRFRRRECPWEEALDVFDMRGQHRYPHGGAQGRCGDAQKAGIRHVQELLGRQSLEATARLRGRRRRGPARGSLPLPRAGSTHGSSRSGLEQPDPPTLVRRVVGDAASPAACPGGRPGARRPRRIGGPGSPAPVRRHRRTGAGPLTRAGRAGSRPGSRQGDGWPSGLPVGPAVWSWDAGGRRGRGGRRS